MKILAVDTTSEYIVLALKNGGSEDYFVSERGCKKHNSTLLFHIDEILKKNGLTLADVDVFGVAVGPGSFTGIRVGVATVNAFALALGKKTVEVTTLELPAEEDDVVTMLDCRHNNFYCGVFRGGKREYLALTEEEAEKIPLPKIRMEGVYPGQLLKKCADKAAAGDFCAQAKPFYLKPSSAERETGIICRT